MEAFPGPDRPPTHRPGQAGRLHLLPATGAPAAIPRGTGATDPTSQIGKWGRTDGRSGVRTGEHEEARASPSAQPATAAALVVGLSQTPFDQGTPECCAVERDRPVLTI